MGTEEEINFKGTITLEDKAAREWLSILERKITDINERTKRLVLDIKKLKKELEEIVREKLK